MATYTIRSVKQTETIDGTLTEAITRARAIEAEYQPAFGVAIELDGSEVWSSEDAGDLTTYHWSTDAASGTIDAATADDALGRLIDQGEWAPIDSPRESREIADGAWLMIGEDAAGECLIARGRA